MKRPEFEIAKNIKGPSQMERVRAARAIIEANNSHATEMAGFLAIFHPELDEKRRRELMEGAREKDRQR